MKMDGKKKKKCEKLKNVILFYHFTLEIFNWGVFLPITKTPKYSTTVLNSVNDTQDFMCIKYKAFLPCKQHPIVYTISLPELAWKKCKQTGWWFILVVNSGVV